MELQKHNLGRAILLGLRIAYRASRVQESHTGDRFSVAMSLLESALEESQYWNMIKKMIKNIKK